MKVVINKKHGGFGLSEEAERRIADKCEHARAKTPPEYFGEDWERRLAEARRRNESSRIFRTTFLEDGRIIHDGHRADDARTCPELVRLVEEMGDAANGEFARLRVVEIPDGVDFEIDDYDGLERIAERHRTWG